MSGKPYELTLRFVDRAGQRAALNTVFVVGLDVTAREALYDVAGTITVRLPRGTYQLGAFLPNGADNRFAGTMLVQPELALTGPATVVLDAGLGKPVSSTAPEQGRPGPRLALVVRRQCRPGRLRRRRLGLLDPPLPGRRTGRHVGSRLR